jgi:hypothetical protein
MKTTFKTILLLAITVVFYNCENAIDIEQPGRLGAESAFQTVSDLQSGLLGSYDFLDTTYEIGFTASFTDEVFEGTDNGGQNFALQNFNVNTSNGFVSNLWVSYYSAIGLANRVLEAAATINPSEDEQVDYNNILGEAYAIRAYAHFKIMAYFSPDMRDGTALAGVLQDFVPDDTFATPSRATNDAFISLINSDLDNAASLITKDQGNIFFNQDVITAIKARFNTYLGNYAVADALAADLLGSYPIANTTQYSNMYLDSDETEVIFKLKRVINGTKDGQGTSGGGWAGSLFAFVDATAGGGQFMEISRSVYNILDGTADVRLGRNVNLPESTIDPGYATNPGFKNSDVLIINKYPGTAAKNLLNDLKDFRSAEMLLIRAEAAANNNALGDVATFIKELRDARFGSAQPTPTYASQQEAYGAILDERRLEFLFEGHRYLDLKRLGAAGNRSIDRDATECAGLAGCTLPVSDYRFTMPIPQLEVTGNPTIQQNPNY